MILRPGNTDRKFTRYSGLDVLRELYQVHNVQTPVIALTVVARAEIRQELNKLGVADIVKKPVRPSDLKDRVDAVFDATT